MDKTEGKTRILLITAFALLAVSANFLGSQVYFSDPTTSPTITKPSLTVTAKATLTSTATVTQTPSCPSVEEIHNELRSDFLEINQRLINVEQELGKDKIVESVRDEFVSNILWEIVNPIFWALIGTIPVIGKLIYKRKINQATVDGKSVSETDSKIYSFFDLLTIVYVAVTVIVLFALALRGTMSPGLNDNRSLNAIVDRLDRIEDKLQETSYSGQAQMMVGDINFVIVFLLFVSVAANVMLVKLYGGEMKQTKSGSGKISNGTKNILLDSDTFPAVLLALFLLLLPHPADTLLLPFVVKYYLVAFLQIVDLYPDRSLSYIILKNYSAIVFLSYFGVWYGFLSTLLNYFQPFWNVFQSVYLQDELGIQYYWTYFAWRMIPMLLSVVVAIPQWRRAKSTNQLTGVEE